jgi:hypothetical protein
MMINGIPQPVTTRPATQPRLSLDEQRTYNVMVEAAQTAARADLAAAQTAGTGSGAVEAQRAAMQAYKATMSTAHATALAAVLALRGGGTTGPGGASGSPGGGSGSTTTPPGQSGGTTPPGGTGGTTPPGGSGGTTPPGGTGGTTPPGGTGGATPPSGGPGAGGSTNPPGQGGSAPGHTTGPGPSHRHGLGLLLRWILEHVAGRAGDRGHVHSQAATAVVTAHSGAVAAYLKTAAMAHAAHPHESRVSRHI